MVVEEYTLFAENVSDIFAEINKQIWEFEEKYHVRPKFIKMGYLTTEYFRRYVSNTFTYWNDQRFRTIMGLCICETPAIKDFTIEVF